MKAIMISIKPKTCANIMNHIQSILVIKNKREANAIQKLIDENGYADIYVYCSKKEELYKFSWSNITWYKNFKHFTDMGCDQAHALYSDDNLNGKVLFKFRCYKVEEIENHILHDYMETRSLSCVELKKQSCLDLEDLYKYLNVDNGYAIHISDLEIFDKPKELSEFNHFKKTIDWCLLPLERAPQNMVYIESEE